MLGSASSLRRANAASSPSDMPPLPQCLPLGPITLGSHKYTRSGELRRVLGVPLGRGAPSDDHSFVAHPKPSPPVATEELKHFKESVQDTSRRAKDRVKLLRDSLFKLEKYKESLSSRKRQRGEAPLNAASAVKLQKNGHGGLTPQRMEERTKGTSMNKRVRTSMSDVRADSRSTGSSRQQMVLEKGGEMVQDAGGVTIRLDEKTRPLPAGGEGWDMKNKKKRSSGLLGSRVMNADRDMKRATHPKMNTDSKFQSCDAQGFRLKSSTGVGRINKMDSSLEPSSSDSSAAIRNELESAHLSTDRVALMEQRTVSKGINKPNIHEDSLTSSPNMTIKEKVSRAPRTGSVMLLDSSLKVHPLSTSLQDSEQPTNLSRVPTSVVTNDHKGHISPGSSSHAMAQWVGQRPHKNSRTRRANIVAPVSNHVEAQISSQAFLASDFNARTSSTGTSGSLITSSIDNNNPNFKSGIQSIPSPFGLSESEESGAGDDHPKSQRIDTGHVPLNPTPEVRGLLPTKRNKFPKNEIGDRVRRQGRSGRGSCVTRPGTHPVREKLENITPAKPLPILKPASDKNKSKTGRPPSKKLKDRKSVTRVGLTLNGDSVDSIGEPDDDHEELLAAANCARNSSDNACTGSFWKKMESIFSSISSEDMCYLKQQLNFAEELDESLSQILGPNCDVLGVLVHKEVPDISRVPRVSKSDVKLTKAAAFGGRVDYGSLGRGVPLYQRVLSALIEEDESEELHIHTEGKNIPLQYASDDSHCGSCNLIDIEPRDRDRMESEAESKVNCPSQKSCFMDGISCDKSVGSNGIGNSSFCNSLHNIEQWPGDTFSHSDPGPAGDICSSDPCLLQMRALSSPSISSSDHQYQLMCLDDRLLLELHSVGLFPDSLPDLVEGEVINQGIKELKEGLCQQIAIKKRKLGKIDKAVQRGKDAERRNIEQIAMDQLIERAYRKRLACSGKSNSRSTVRKVSRQVALAFVKRTVARCRKFEETGNSCFSEPALQEVIFSTSACNNGSKSGDCVGSGTASNNFNEVYNHYTEARGSGAISSTFEREESHSNNFDTGRKREVLIDDVAGSASSRIRSTLECTVLGGVKSNRSGSNENPYKDKQKSGSVSVVDGSPLNGLKRGRKTKSKLKQRSYPSASGNGPRGSTASVANTSNQAGTEVGTMPLREASHYSSKENESIDVGNLQLHEFDNIGLEVSNDLTEPQDLSSWLNIDADGLQDHDSIGLEIPMDDLSDLQMLM